MSNPNINTKTQQKHIDLNALQRNQEDCKDSLIFFLSCARNPEQFLGKSLVLPKDKFFAKNMQTLEKLGYVRNPEENCFELPQKPKACPFKEPHELEDIVKIADGDKQFVQKMEWLEDNGYIRVVADNCWKKESIHPMEAIFQKEVGISLAKNMLGLTKGTLTLGFVLISFATGLFVKGL